MAAAVQDGKDTKFFTLEKTFYPTETRQCGNTFLDGWAKKYPKSFKVKSGAHDHLVSLVA